MRVELSVELDGNESGLREVVCDARDFREWEVYALSQRPPLPVKQDAADFPMTLWLTRLCFTAMRRAGTFDGKWADFDSRCTGIEPTEADDEDETPTQPGPTPG